MELLLNAFDLIPRRFRLLVIHLRGSRARQSPLCAAHNPCRHFQIAQQFGACSNWSFLLRLSLGFEEQIGIIQNAFADSWRAFAPRAIQLAGFPRIAVVLGEDHGHALAIIQALACHRHQKLQGRLRHNLALTHLPLNRFWQNLHQRQSSRYPAHTAVEPARQLIEPVVEAPL